jgi:sugar lactone lactonase YvrE
MPAASPKGQRSGFGRRLRRGLRRVLVGLFSLVVVLAIVLRWRYGGGRTDFPERIGEPLLPPSALEVVASFPGPPGNVAVSAQGRIFLSVHPEGHPEVKVVELVDGTPRPFPGPDWQQSRGVGADGQSLPFFESILGVRLDAQGRLWTVDNANHGLGQPRLLAFDIATGTLVDRWDVPRELAGLGSHLNDLQVTPDGRHVLVADASIFGLDPALLVYDVGTGQGRRVLSGHPSVQPEPYIPIVGGRTMQIFDLFAIRPGVDSMGIDVAGEWLYFAPLTAQRMYRARLSDLVDPRLAPADLADRVEDFAAKPMTDGIAMDTAGNLVLTDFPHDALQLLAADGHLTTLLRDPRLRWPDGLSYGPGPDGTGVADWLYVTSSALQRVIGRTPGQIRAAGPYHLFRIHMPAPGVAGH